MWNDHHSLTKPAGVRLIYLAAIDLQLPIAVWRSPGKEQPAAVVDLSGRLTQAKPELNALGAGFLMSPFAAARANTSYFIPADLLLRDGHYSAAPGPQSRDDKSAENRTRFEHRLQELRVNGNGLVKPGSWFVGNKSQRPQAAITREAYREQVQLAVDTIAGGALRKVVLSRAVEIQLHEQFHPCELFSNLCRAYPTAFVSLVSLPGVGTWIGATPELLLSVSQNQLTTVALAGTRPVESNDKAWSGKWCEKEIVEQAIVSEYIREAFHAQGIHDYQEAETESVRIGALLHLQTKFSLTGLDARGPKVVENILTALHPTPAVCGVPKTRATDFIQSHEPHDREFYAGYLGPVNLDGASHLYVNLRCLQALEHSAILYAGGGITIDSIPEQEWLETELKLDALLNVMNGNVKSSTTDAQNGAGKVLCYD